MAGERILIVDDSHAVQDVSRSILQEFGYQVAVASNGIAALSHPNAAEFDLLVVDSDMELISGQDTIRIWRGNEETAGIPILLLIPEEAAESRASESVEGATSFLLKPYEPRTLLRKVKSMVRESKILSESEAYLAKAADQAMSRLAEKQIADSVERKTQIIIERAIQAVITQVDQRARTEVDQRVTALTQDKEQELVRMTVREVANSMVEKLASRKVNEAIEAVLHEKTENSVRRAADNALPTLARDQIREQLELNLPGIVEKEVTTVAENQASDIATRLVSVVEGVAQKSVPKIIREKLPELSEQHLQAAAQTVLPPEIERLTRATLDEMSTSLIEPKLQAATRKLKRVNMGILIITLVAALAAVAVLIATVIFADKGSAMF